MASQPPLHHPKGNHLGALIAAGMVPADRSFTVWRENLDPDYLHVQRRCMLERPAAEPSWVTVTAAELAAAADREFTGPVRLCSCLSGGAIDDVTISGADYQALTWLWLAHYDHAADTRNGRIVTVAYRLATCDLPTDPRLLPPVHERLRHLTADLADLTADPDHIAERRRRHLAGIRTLTGSADGVSPHPRLLRLLADIDTSTTAAAARAARMPVWVLASPRVRTGGADSVWLWASDIPHRSRPDGPLLLRIPAGLALTVNPDSFEPLCLDDQHPLDRIETAVELAGLDDVAAMVTALAHAEA